MKGCLCTDEGLGVRHRQKISHKHKKHKNKWGIFIVAWTLFACDVIETWRRWRHIVKESRLAESASFEERSFARRVCWLPSLISEFWRPQQIKIKINVKNLNNKTECDTKKRFERGDVPATAEVERTHLQALIGRILSVVVVVVVVAGSVHSYDCL